MRSGLTLFTLLGFAAASCGNSNRHFASSSAGAGGQSGGSGGATSSAGRSSTAGSAGHGPIPGTAGSGGMEPEDNAGAGGMPDEPPPDLCIGVKCDSPPASDCLSTTEFQSYDSTGTCTAGECKYVSHSIPCTCKSHACTSDPCASVTCNTPPAVTCKDANTLITYAASGACSAGSCSYTPTETPCAYGCANNACKADPCATMVCKSPPAATCKDTSTRVTYTTPGTCSASRCSYGTTDAPCTGDTPKCKDPGNGSQCVACLGNADCSNGGTCNASNACVCSNRFNGKHCEFQVFRSIGVLENDAYSRATNISHDGSVIVGSSVNNANPPASHAVRVVNGGALQFIANPSGSTGTCSALAADSAGNVLLSCDNGAYVYSAGGVATSANWPTGGLAYDVSPDGKVIVGTAADGKAVRQASGTNTSYGPFLPSGDSRLYGISGDGSIAAGAHHGPGVTGNGYVAMRWTSGTGLTSLTGLSNWIYTSATDISADGKVIVGWASAESEVLSGQIPVKWSGGSLTPTALGAAVAQASATSVNSDGSVIVGYQGGAPTVATLWDSGGAHAIKDLVASTPDFTSAWTLDTAVGVSDDGKFIVGNGTFQGRSEGWVIHLP
ncbi:MAG TPA: hypothetical protein VER96_27795 [Polyangiaceae bacterium]|nr:hypothetical protein [Polyangiaceae bacterium]